jgi:hypothetical protein
MQKILHFILDFLLIFGALVSILTIDGGKWLISNPAFYQPGLEGANNILPVPVEIDAAEVSTLEVKPQAAPVCDTVSTPIFLNEDARSLTEREPVTPAPLALACK